MTILPKMIILIRKLKTIYQKSNLQSKKTERHDEFENKPNRKRSVSADCFRIVMAFCFLCTAFSILHGIFLFYIVRSD